LSSRTRGVAAFRTRALEALRRNPGAPAAPAFASDKGIALFRSIVKKYISRGDVRTGYYLAGMASAYSFVDALKKAGKNSTRRSLMAAMLKLDEKTNPFVLPGITVKTGSKDRRWQKDHWLPVGAVLNAR